MLQENSPWLVLSAGRTDVGYWWAGLWNTHFSQSLPRKTYACQNGYLPGCPSGTHLRVRPAPLCRQSGLHMQRYTEMRRSPSSPPPAFLSISTPSYTVFSHNHHPHPHPHPTLLGVLFCQDSSLTPDFQSPMSPASFSFLISVSPGFSLKAASLACCPAGPTGALVPASLL